VTSLFRAGPRLCLPITSILALALLLAVLTTGPATADHATAVVASNPSEVWGVYSGPAAKNVSGARAFAASTGMPITGTVDFPPERSWADMTGPGWLLNPYTGSGLALEYSLPLLPEGVDANGKPWTLEACANGAYNAYWSQLGRNLVAASLPATVIRPGWEFNGAWFRWNAVGKTASFVDCFRRVVTTMRAVPGSQFRFDWNPNIGPASFPADQAYPGDAYVDVVGVDVYDVSWTAYPIPAGTSPDTAYAAAWSWLLKGDHGLNFWSSFAQLHAKPMSITEWGVTWRSDGHGGGDDRDFIDRMLGFITDPANHVVANNYFNIDTPDLRHDLTRQGTIFPASFARLHARAANYAVAPAATPTDTKMATAKVKAKAKAKERKHTLRHAARSYG
jgi:hypothetical protein